MTKLVRFITRKARAAREQRARAEAAAGADAAVVNHETLKNHYGIDLDDVLASLPDIEAQRVETAERLRRAALRAIDRELAVIRAERTP